jgi:hypothetical protein
MIIQQATSTDMRVNLIIETFSILHPTTHKANKVQAPVTMKTVGFMQLTCRLATSSTMMQSQQLVSLCKPFGIHSAVAMRNSTASLLQQPHKWTRPANTEGLRDAMGEED